MRKIFKIMGVVVGLFVIACAYSFFTDKSRYGPWQVQVKDTTMPWAPFSWGSDSMGDRYFERATMNIPVRIDGIPFDCTMQFDLGSNATVLYGNTLNTLYRQSNAERRVQRLKSPLQFWNRNKSYKDLRLHMGAFEASTKNGIVMADYGSSVVPTSTPVHIGSIGADLFQNRVLIIDYPNSRFCILDTVPSAYTSQMYDIRLSSGRAVIPVTFKGKTYNALFDNGSSLFALLVPGAHMDRYSRMNNVDTVLVNSWGQKHDITKRILDAPVSICGESFDSTPIWADYRPDFEQSTKREGYDLITGNALFWDGVVVIDFKRRKFGIKNNNRQ